MRKDSFGCRVSCTGLYADVSYSKGNPEDTSMDEEDKILDTDVFSKLTMDYKDFKNKFVRNIIFNSSSPSLGAHFTYIDFPPQIFNIYWLFSCQFSRVTERRWDLLCWDLLWHSNIWRGRTRQEDDLRGPTRPHWGNDGSSHWVLHPQWGRDHLLRHQALCLTQGEPHWRGCRSPGKVQESPYIIVSISLIHILLVNVWMSVSKCS